MVTFPKEIEERMQSCYSHPTVHKMIIVKLWPHAEPSINIGDEVTIKQWATFGAYDTKGRWIDFYSCEPA